MAVCLCRKWPGSPRPSTLPKFEVLLVQLSAADILRMMPCLAMSAALENMRYVRCIYDSLAEESQPREINHNRQ